MRLFCAMAKYFNVHSSIVALIRTMSWLDEIREIACTVESSCVGESMETASKSTVARQKFVTVAHL